ncbi:MAG: AraC family transcriptional regulator [Hyphomonadaceae bacterium]|nr:AraC family transcriptional regulator [Hyphomonadaceae bacterium]
MQDATLVTGRQLEPLLQEAERSGIATRKVLKSLGFEALGSPAERAQAELRLADYFRIEGELARQLDDLTAHLSERKLTYETGAFVTAQMGRSTTLNEALNNLAQYFNMMHGEHYNTVRTTGRTVSLIIDDSAFPYTMRDDVEMVRFIGECVLIKVHCLLDSLSGGLAAKALRRVTLKRPSAASLPSHLRFWQAPVSFGQSNYELCFDHELAHSQMPPPDKIDLTAEGVFSRVIDYLDQLDPSQAHVSYTSKVLDLIRNGVVQQDSVAHRLSVSVATLRRRLEQENTNFRELISAHFVEQATQLLQKGHSVSHVSDVLNYSDIRAFNRAFKRWRGETPAQYARRHAAQKQNA